MSSRKRRVPYAEEETRGGFTFPDGETCRPKRNFPETPEIDICSYSIEEGISPSFDPIRALLRRLFFVDENRIRYVSVDFYHQLTTCLLEFGVSKIRPIRLPVEQVMALFEHVPRLFDASCTNARYTSGIHDGFRISTTAYRTARMQLS